MSRKKVIAEIKRVKSLLEKTSSADYSCDEMKGFLKGLSKALNNHKNKSVWGWFTVSSEFKARRYGWTYEITWEHRDLYRQWEDEEWKGMSQKLQVDRVNHVDSVMKNYFPPHVKIHRIEEDQGLLTFHVE